MANIIQNGGFSGSAYWTCGARTYVYVNGGRTGGSTDGCACLENNGEGGARDLYQKVSVTPGKTYTLSFWAKRRGRYDVWAAYSYYDTSGNYQYVNLSSKESLLVNEQYVQITYMITIPTNAGLDFWIWIRGGANAGDGSVWLFIDDVSLDDGGSGGSTGPSIGSGMVAGDYANTNAGVNVRSNYGTEGTIYLYQTENHEQFSILNSFAHSDGYTWYLVSNQNRRITNGWVRGDLLTKLPAGLGGKKMFLVSPASGSDVNVRDASTNDFLSKWPKGRKFAGTYCDGGAKVRTFYVKQAKPATIESQFATLLGEYPGIITALTQVCEAEIGRVKADYDATDSSWDWCQTFANWTAMLAGANWDSRYSINGCTSMMNQIFSTNKTAAQSPNVPLPGDWVYYRKNVNSTTFDHIGIVISATSSSMTTIEGNRGTQVAKFTNLPLYIAPSGSDNNPCYFVSPPFKV